MGFQSTGKFSNSCYDTYLSILVLSAFVVSRSFVVVVVVVFNKNTLNLAVVGDVCELKLCPVK